MICPTCQKKGTKSCVHEGCVTTTCVHSSLAYYDEDGKYTNGRNDNSTKTDFICTLGHKFQVTTKQGHPDKIEEENI